MSKFKIGDKVKPKPLSKKLALEILDQGNYESYLKNFEIEGIGIIQDIWKMQSNYPYNVKIFGDTMCYNEKELVLYSLLKDKLMLLKNLK